MGQKAFLFLISWLLLDVFIIFIDIRIIYKRIVVFRIDIKDGNAIGLTFMAFKVK